MSQLLYLNSDKFAAPKAGQPSILVVWGQYHKPGYKYLPFYSKLQAKYGDKVSLSPIIFPLLFP